MLLKFVMGGRDFDGRLIEAGRLVKWYIAEGASVDYGDDLCDLEIDAVQVPDGLWEVREERWLQPAQIAELASRQLGGQPVRIAEINPDSFQAASIPGWSFVVRITSTDRGVIRRLCAGEGERRVAGDLLAVLSTEPGESIEAADATLHRAGTFRVVANLVPWHDLAADAAVTPDPDIGGRAQP